ncbi:MAG: LysR family transcriptional activator of nhaA [Arenicella sp.]|jgi:LysR family transcriptional activator of nhaA
MSCVLFENQGRKLILTVPGTTALKYVDEIFELGNELNDVMRGTTSCHQSEFVVGAASSLPKTIVCKISEPSLLLPGGVNLISIESPVSTLLADLSTHKPDIVISDTPTNKVLGAHVINHYLGECRVTFFAVSELNKRLAPNFPKISSSISHVIPYMVIRDKAVI